MEGGQRVLRTSEHCGLHGVLGQMAGFRYSSRRVLSQLNQSFNQSRLVAFGGFCGMYTLAEAEFKQQM